MSGSSLRSGTSGKPATAALDSIIADIRKMVGLQHIKDDLQKLVAFGELFKLRRERDIPMGRMGLHMVFVGPPGTGKTVLARKFGELFKAMGLLREGRVVEVDRAAIVGKAIGDAEHLMKNAFEQARNGVLFIDEAYSLAGISAEDPTKDVSDPYGKGAVDTLMKLMEDNRGSVMVIVAGYKEPMRRFLKTNAGLASRFAKTYEFPSYKHGELLDIFCSMSKDWKYILEPDAISAARRFIQEWDIESRTFGNAREVRTFFETILPVQADRIASIPNFKDLPNEDILTISAEDVDIAVQHYESRV